MSKHALSIPLPARAALPACARLRSLASIAALAVLVPSADAAQLVSRFTDWASYAHEEEGQKLCFTLSEPKTQEPKAVKRDPAHFFVSAWPKAGVKTEISIKMGYSIKKGSEATVTIGEEAFRLFADADRAFVADPMQELKLLEAMKKGTRVVVQATSERGTATTDSYSLAGLTQALQAMAAACQ